MIGSRFCHACGVTRPEKNGSAASTSRTATPDLLAQKFTWWLQSATAQISRRKVTLPAWLRYLHFHEIKRWVGLPTPSLMAFFIGIGCVLGAIGVSLFFKASNLDRVIRGRNSSEKAWQRVVRASWAFSPRKSPVSL
jgi:hypothetical protein